MQKMQKQGIKLGTQHSSWGSLNYLSLLLRADVMRI